MFVAATAGDGAVAAGVVAAFATGVAVAASKEIGESSIEDVVPQCAMVVAAAGEGAVAAGVDEAVHRAFAAGVGTPCAMMFVAAAGDGAVAAGVVAAVAAGVAVAAVTNCIWSCCNCQLPIESCV